MLAARFPESCRPVAAERSRWRRVHSVSSAGFDAQRWGQRPFRARITAPRPGAGRWRQPAAAGEISLAHHGILFLDELPEFDRDVLEALREPLECGRISISRAARQAHFPARFQLVAAMNPCPAGTAATAAGGAAARPSASRAIGAASRGRSPTVSTSSSRCRRRARRSWSPRSPASPRTASRTGRAGARVQLQSGQPNALLGTREIDRLAPDREATSCCATRLRGCCSRRAPITACCAWRARSRTSAGKANRSGARRGSDTYRALTRASSTFPKVSSRAAW